MAFSGEKDRTKKRSSEASNGRVILLSLQDVLKRETTKNMFGSFLLLVAMPGAASSDALRPHVLESFSTLTCKWLTNPSKAGVLPSPSNQRIFDGTCSRARDGFLGSAVLVTRRCHKFHTSTARASFQENQIQAFALLCLSNSDWTDLLLECQNISRLRHGYVER